MKRLALLLLAACGSSQPAPAPVAPPPVDTPPVSTTTTTATPAPLQHGALLGDIDRAANPCDDFFAFANGAWRKDHPIPASQPKWSRRWESGEINKERLKSLLEETAAKQNAAGTTEQIVGDFYGACMDEARIDAAGATPLATHLAAIDAVKTRPEIQQQLIALHWLSNNAGFFIGAQQDPHEPNRVLADIGAAGLGLPDRDYYLKTDARFVETRKRYREHAIKLFQLAGRKETAAQIDAAIALEARLAKATLDNVAQRDPKNLDHPTTFAQLAKLAPHFDWTAYFAAFSIPQDAINVQEPKFVTAFDSALAQVPVATWKTYLAWRLIADSAPWLAKPFVDEDFAFTNAYLEGAKEQKPRWKRCAEITDAVFGEALGKTYVSKYFSPAAKARVQKMVDNILLATGDAIREATWMSDTTKQRALGKLATFNPKIGYPDTWKTYAGVTVKRDDFIASLEAGVHYGVTDDRSQIGKPVDRKRWGMTPPTSNAYYNPQLNEIVFPAGILMSPMFDMEATDAVNYGAIGVVIGHEVSHGFDDQGAQYDEKGALSNWWTKDDLAKFQARGTCVSDQFEGYFIEPKIHHNGKLVLGESIGDLGGVTIAWRAFQRSLAGGTAPTIDGFTPAQQFFLGYGQSRGDETRPETQRKMVQGDPHPVAKFRVIGPLSNSPTFAQAFSCKAGDAMVRADNQRCTVW